MDINISINIKRKDYEYLENIGIIKTKIDSIANLSNSIVNSAYYENILQNIDSDYDYIIIKIKPITDQNK